MAKSLENKLRDAIISNFNNAKKIQKEQEKIDMLEKSIEGVRKKIEKHEKTIEGLKDKKTKIYGDPRSPEGILNTYIHKTIAELEKGGK